MNIFFRILLKKLLGFFSQWAIKKHKINLIVVVGWYGIIPTRELIYSILHEKTKVRRNTRDIWWDFSIPLAILGYKDHERSIYEWCKLLLSAAVYLMFGRVNQHTLILSADCTFPATAAYWSSFVKPDLLVIVNDDEQSQLIRNLVEKSSSKATILYNPSKIKQKLKALLNDKRTFTFGNLEDNDLIVVQNNEYYEISYGNQKLKVTAKIISANLLDTLAAALAVGVKNNMSLKDAVYETMKSDFNTIFIQRIKKTLIS